MNTAEKNEKYGYRPVQVNMRKEEYEKVKEWFANSTSWSMSEYCRKVLIGKPVIIFYRDQSFDAFMEEAVALRKEFGRLSSDAKISQEGITLMKEIKYYMNKIFDHVSKNKT